MFKDFKKKIPILLFCVTVTVMVGYNIKLRVDKTNDIKRIIKNHKDDVITGAEALEELEEKYGEDKSISSKYYDGVLKVKVEMDRKEQSTNPVENIIEVENLTPFHGEGNQELKLKLINNTKKDIDYIKINIFEINSDGKVVNSDYAVSNKVIVSGGEVVIETYFDYQKFDSKLKYELDDVRYR